MKLNTAQKGLAGEFFTLAQLTRQGLTASLTLGNTKGVDILVANEKTGDFFKVEVKTTSNKPNKSTLCYQWTLSKNNEITIENLIYCFVYLPESELDQMPQFYLVRNEIVGPELIRSHKEWLKKPGRKDSSMRKFRIEKDDPKNYKDNWSVFK